MAASDVSAALADVAAAAPTNGISGVADPEPLSLADVARRILESSNDARTVVPDESVGYFGGAVTDESLMPEMI